MHFQRETLLSSRVISFRRVYRVAMFFALDYRLTVFMAYLFLEEEARNILLQRGVQL